MNNLYSLKICHSSVHVKLAGKSYWKNTFGKTW